MSNGITIGEVNINLRMSLAQFKQDTRDGQQAASVATKQIADDVKENSGEARGALVLLGEEIGVHIPRHLQAFIAELPGVSTALNAAFNSVAVLAIIGLIVEITEKVAKFQENAKKLKEEMENVESAGVDAFRALDVRVLELQKEIATLSGDKVAALQDSLKILNLTTLGDLSNQLKAVSKELDELLSKQVTSWWLNLFVGDNAGVKQVKDQADSMLAVLKDLKNAGDTKGYGDTLANELRSAQAAVEGQVGGSKQVKAAWATVVMELEILQGEYTRTAEIAKGGAAVAIAQGAKDAAEMIQKELAALKELENSTDNVLGKTISPLDREVQKLQEVIGKWEDYKRIWEDAHGGISSVANSNIEALQHEVDLLKAEAQSAIALALQAASLENKKNTYDPLLNTQSSKPIYGGTKQAQELYDIQTKSTAAVQKAQEVYSSTRTAAENYAQQMAVLNQLLQQGAIDEDTYTRAKVQAENEYHTLSGAVRELGVNIGQTIEQAALFGGSWSQAFENVAVQIGQLILQLLFMKALTAESNAGGAGGFLANIAGGLIGKAPGRATGGAVEAGYMYRVNENHDELFMPTVPGKILTDSSAPSSASRPVNVNQSINIQTPNADSFKRSQAQISAQMYRDAAAAHGRLRR